MVHFFSEIAKSIEQDENFRAADMIEFMIRNSYIADDSYVTLVRDSPKKNLSIREMWDVVHMMYLQLNRVISNINRNEKQARDIAKNFIKSSSEEIEDNLKRLHDYINYYLFRDVDSDYKLLKVKNDRKVVLLRKLFKGWMECILLYIKILDYTEDTSYKKSFINDSSIMYYYDKFLPSTLMTDKNVATKVFFNTVCSYGDALRLMEEGLRLPTHVFASLLRNEDLINPQSLNEDREKLIKSIFEWYPNTANCLSKDNGVVELFLYYLNSNFLSKDNSLRNFIKRMLPAITKEEFLKILEIAMDNDMDLNIFEPGGAFLGRDFTSDVLVKAAEIFSKHKVDSKNLSQLIGILSSNRYNVEQLYLIDGFFSKTKLLSKIEEAFLFMEDDLETPYSYEIDNLVYNGFLSKETTIKFLTESRLGFDELKRKELLGSSEETQVMEEVLKEMARVEDVEAFQKHQGDIHQAVQDGIVQILSLQPLIGKEIPIVYREGEKFGLDKSVIDQFAASIPVYIVNHDRWHELTNSYNFLGMNINRIRGAYVTNLLRHDGVQSPFIILVEVESGAIEDSFFKNINITPVLNKAVLAHETMHWLYDLIRKIKGDYDIKKEIEGLEYYDIPTEIYAFTTGDLKIIYENIKIQLYKSIDNPIVKKIIEQVSLYNMQQGDEHSNIDKMLREDIKNKNVLYHEQSKVEMVRSIQEENAMLKEKLKIEGDESNIDDIRNRIRENEYKLKLIIENKPFVDINIDEIAEIIFRGYVRGYFISRALQYRENRSKALERADSIVDSIVGGYFVDLGLDPVTKGDTEEYIRSLDSQ